MKKLLLFALFSFFCIGAGARSITLVFDDGTKVYYHSNHIATRFQAEVVSSENREILYRIHDPVDQWYNYIFGGWGWVSDYKNLKKKIELAGQGDKIKGFSVEYLGKKRMDILVKKCVKYRFGTDETETMPEMILTERVTKNGNGKGKKINKWMKVVAYAPSSYITFLLCKHVKDNAYEAEDDLRRMGFGCGTSEKLGWGLAVAAPIGVAITTSTLTKLILDHSKSSKWQNMTKAVQYGILKDGEHYFLVERPTFKDNEYIKGSADDDAEGMTDNSTVYKGRSASYAPPSYFNRNFEQ